MRYRFEGEICGFGTTSGTRIVIGRWPVSPFGPVADVMIEDGEGVRHLLGADLDLLRFVAGTYHFDRDATVVPGLRVTRLPERLTVESDELTVEVVIGARTRLGVALRAVPHPVSAAPWWAALINPIARHVVDGVHTRGSAKDGRREWYGAHDVHRLVEASACWRGDDLGPMGDVDPPVRFGFASTPRRPSITAVTTTVEV